MKFTVRYQLIQTSSDKVVVECPEVNQLRLPHLHLRPQLPIDPAIVHKRPTFTGIVFHNNYLGKMRSVHLPQDRPALRSATHTPVLRYSYLPPDSVIMRTLF